MSEKLPSSLGYLKPYRRPMAIGVAFLLVTNVAYLGVPEMTRHAIDGLGVESRSTILFYVILGGGFALATALTRIVSRALIFNAPSFSHYDST